ITTYSDARIKSNVEENVPGLDFVCKLRPVTYNKDPEKLHQIWGTPAEQVAKIDFTDTRQQRYIGFLAQEVEQAALDCGFEFPGIDVPANDHEAYSLRYGDFIMPLVKAVQEQQAQIEALTNALKKQQEEIERLKERH
nr:tail fiber domain-containing protein [Bacteroidales bacterium]